MASIQKRKRKRGAGHIVQFALNGRRGSIYLGREYSRAEVREIAGQVEVLVSGLKRGGAPDGRTAAWLAALPEGLRRKFERAGLIPGSDAGATLGDLFERFRRETSGRRGRSAGENVEYAERAFFRVEDRDRPAREFGRGDAERFAGALAESGYSAATQSLIVTILKSVFSWAVDSGLTKENPFARVRRRGTGNRAREFYVDMKFFGRMLSSCGSARDRALLTLYRVGGLRRSEALLVRWRDVDFDRGRLTVRSPKTARHEGGECRVIPLFPALREELTALRSERRDASGDDPAIGCSAPYVRKLIQKVLARAGLPEYPRLVQNLRASASIDVFREFGEIAENAWLGHTFATAKKHYLRVLEEDYDRAAGLKKD